MNRSNKLLTDSADPIITTKNDDYNRSGYEE